MIIQIVAIAIVIIIMITIDDLQEEYNFLSDIFTLENNYSYQHFINESCDIDLENVSIILNFVKPITPCHATNRTGFANLNHIKR